MQNFLYLCFSFCSPSTILSIQVLCLPQKRRKGTKNFAYMQIFN